MITSIIGLFHDLQDLRGFDVMQTPKLTQRVSVNGSIFISGTFPIAGGLQPTPLF